MIEYLKRMLKKLPIPENFYTEGTPLTMSQKRRIVSLVASDDFRVYEQYMAWKQNRKAHRLPPLNREGKAIEAAYISGQIDMLAEQTQDMAVFWEEVKRSESADEDEKKKPKYAMLGPNQHALRFTEEE